MKYVAPVPMSVEAIGRKCSLKHDVGGEPQGSGVMVHGWCVSYLSLEVEGKGLRFILPDLVILGVECADN